MSQEIYCPENVPLYEAMYGPGLISLGGYVSIDKMFEGLELKKKSVLDIGSGIGGMVYHLARNYGAMATGLEIHPWMVEYGNTHTPEDLKSQVSFMGYNTDGTIPAETESFDIVCSKGVLTNIIDKKPLFQEIQRVLKPQGLICFLDWLVPEGLGPQYITHPWGEFSAKETLLTYTKLLKDIGFNDIHIQDENESFLSYVKDLHYNLQASKIQNKVDPDLLKILIESNKKLENDIRNGNQIAVRILARK